MFGGILGTWNTDPVDLELKDDVNPVCLRPYPVPRVYEGIFRKEADRMVKLGVPEEENDSERGSIYFYHPKEKMN